MVQLAVPNMVLQLRLINLLLSLLFFHFHHVAAATTTDTHHHLCLHEERSALLDFKQSFTIKRYAIDANNSYYHKTDSWKVGGDCCRSWDGVECDQISGHVIALDLSSTISSSSYLYGSLSTNSTLFHLLHLQKLNLAFKYFSYSQIPSEIGLLSSLTYLNLSNSYFTGQIPSAVLHLSNLTSLDLYSPYIPGLKLERPNLKELVHNLTKLQHLHLSYVNISSTVPHALATYFSLKTLILSGSELQGEFPAAIFHLPRLHTLDLSGNPNLTGYLPEFCSSSTSSLEELFIMGTNISEETIIASIGNLSILKKLELGLSNYSGWPPLSGWIGRLTNLTYLDLSGNPTKPIMGINSSSFPWLAKLQKLTYLSLSYFEINGEIPSHIVGLTALTDLYLSTNGFSGQVPSWLANLTQLVNLQLSYNQLSGHIPSSLSSLTKIQMLSLRDNKLTGQVPSFFTNFTQLRKLYLSFNRFQGPLPNSFSNLKKLQVFDLFSNNLNGTVELDMFHKMKQLSVLHLSQNNLSLLIKDDVYDIGTHSVSPNKYNALGLGSCNLRKFPTFLRNQNKLRWLDLSSNNIHGKIPKWIWNISTGTLNSLNISHNLLTSFEHYSNLVSGTILRTLEISYNQLQGSLPLPPLSINFYLASNNLWDAQELSPHFCNLSNLIVLDVSNNKMSGMLPQCLSKSLQILDLRNNSFHGTIPESWVRGCPLKMINLSGNQFHGKVPTSLCNCTMLEFIDFGLNHIQDTFPSWLGGLSELRVLIMQSNKFHGVIENYEKDSKFPQLRILDLSYNEFSGNLSSMFFQFMNSMKVLDEKMTYMETSLKWQFFLGKYTCWLLCLLNEDNQQRHGNDIFQDL